MSKTFKIIQAKVIWKLNQIVMQDKRYWIQKLQSKLVWISWFLGLQPPAAIQSCGLSKCPSWTAQAWIPCPRAKCIAKRTGFQTRDVFCAVGDKTVDDKYCEAVLRPRSTQKCRNRRCKGIWKTGLWSKVWPKANLVDIATVEWKS